MSTVALVLSIIGFLLGVGVIVGYGVGCYHWGKYKAKRDLLLLKEKMHEDAVDRASEPIDPGAVLDELSDA